jgi:hypothetical protein
LSQVQKGEEHVPVKSFLRYLEIEDESLKSLTMPSAILSDGGLLTIPIYAVTAMSLNQSYHLPPLGTSGSKAIVSTHDDTLSLSGVLVGYERFAWKLSLETLAESARRGSALEAYSGGRLSGLILVTSMTIRTDIHIQSLSFSASAARRDTLEVSISFVHLPRPGALGKLIDLASLGVASLADWKGN